jgi:multiple sugar transport system substrate-binding protein
MQPNLSHSLEPILPSHDHRAWKSFRNMMFTLIFSSIASLLVGCGTAPPNPTVAVGQKPYAGKILKISVADPVLGGEIRDRAKAWANRTSAQVTVVTNLPPQELKDADIVIIPQETLTGLAARGELASVPETLTGNGKSFRWDTLFVPFQTSLVQWGSQTVAVPIAGDGLVCVYRADRFRDPTAMKAFRTQFQKDLVPPSTWEDVAEIAAAFHQPGKPSLPPLPPDRSALAQFHHIAACYDRVPISTGTKELGSAARALSFHIDAEKFQPRLNAPAFAAAYAWFHQTAAFRSTTAETPLAAISTGSAVVAVLTLRELSQLPRDPKTGAISDNFGIVPVPGTRMYFNTEGKAVQAVTGRNSIPFLGGTGAFAVVSQKSANADAAWDFLNDLASPEGSASTLSESHLGAGPIRESHIAPQTGLAIWQRYGFDERHTKDLSVAMQAYINTGVANPALPLRTPDSPQVYAILEAQLRRAASGQATGPEAANAAVAAWAAHDRTQDAEQLKTWRRKAAGLD